MNADFSFFFRRVLCRRCQPYSLVASVRHSVTKFYQPYKIVSILRNPFVASRQQLDWRAAAPEEKRRVSAGAHAVAQQPAWARVLPLYNLWAYIAGRHRTGLTQDMGTTRAHPTAADQRLIFAGHAAGGSGVLNARIVLASAVPPRRRIENYTVDDSLLSTSLTICGQFMPFFIRTTIHFHYRYNGPCSIAL